MEALPPVNNIQTLYLNEHGADVWFRINDDRIPGHKLILGAMCPYYKTMFYGLVPENNEVNMTDAVESVESFKEFLKFMYLLQPNLSMDNVEDVISLAKQSLSDEFLAVCELFLKKSLTDNPNTIFRIYRLAVLYDLDNLKTICSDYVCVFAEQVLRSSSLPELPLEYLRTVLQCDALACEEIEVFNALMTWAKAVCEHNNLDPSNGKHLRDELKDAIHEIRFTSMTKSEAGHCIRSYPGLFTANELEEIICMVAQEDKFQPKQFNWRPRYFDLNWNKGRFIQFSLLKEYDERKDPFVKRTETIRLSCNRWVLLKSLFYQLAELSDSKVHVVIKEKRGENETVRFSKTLSPHFKPDMFHMPEMEIVLYKPIILRPRHYYDITITFHSEYISPKNYSVYATKKRVDHDIVFHFEENKIVSGLSIYRLDNKNYFQKVFHDPKIWIVLMSVGIAGAAYFKIYHVPKLLPSSCPVVPTTQQQVVQQSLFNSILNSLF